MRQGTRRIDGGCLRFTGERVEEFHPVAAGAQGLPCPGSYTGCGQRRIGHQEDGHPDSHQSFHSVANLSEPAGAKGNLRYGVQVQRLIHLNPASH